MVRPMQTNRPTLEEISTEMSGKVTVAKTTLTTTPDAIQYGVRGIPTLMMFKNGQVAEPKSGCCRRKRWWND